QQRALEEQGSAVAELREEFKALLRRKPSYLQLSYFRPNLRPLIDESAGPAARRDWAGDDLLFQAARRDPQKVVFTPVQSRRRPDPNAVPLLELDAAVPVYHARPGEGVFGVLGVRVDFGQLLIQAGCNRSPRRLTFIVNPQGGFLDHPDPAFIGRFDGPDAHRLKDVEELKPYSFFDLDPKAEAPEGARRLLVRPQRAELKGQSFWLVSGTLPDGLDANRREQLKKLMGEFGRKNDRLRCTAMDDTTTKIYLSSRRREDIDGALADLKTEKLFKEWDLLGPEFGSSIRWNRPVECKTFAVESLLIQGPRVENPLRLNLLVAVSYEELADDVNAAFNTVKWVTFGLSAAAAVFALVFSLILTRPLRRITEATRQ